jgi:hypothetical protein
MSHELVSFYVVLYAACICGSPLQLVVQACNSAPTSLELVCAALDVAAASLSVDGNGTSIRPPSLRAQFTQLAVEYELQGSSCMDPDPRAAAVLFSGRGDDSCCMAALHGSSDMTLLSSGGISAAFFPWICSWMPRCTYTLALQAVSNSMLSSAHANSPAPVILASGAEFPCTCSEGHDAGHRESRRCDGCSYHPPGFFAPGIRRACFRINSPVPPSVVGFVVGAFQPVPGTSSPLAVRPMAALKPNISAASVPEEPTNSAASNRDLSRLSSVELWCPLPPTPLQASLGSAASYPLNSLSRWSGWSAEISSRAAKAIVVQCERAAQFVHEWTGVPPDYRHRFVYLPESLLPSAACLAATPTAYGNPGSSAALLHAFPEQDVVCLAGGITLLPVSYLQTQLLHINTHALPTELVESIVLDHANAAHALQAYGLAMHAIGSPAASSRPISEIEGGAGIADAWLQVGML